MNSNDRNLEDILERALPSASREQIETSRERVFARLKILETAGEFGRPTRRASQGFPWLRLSLGGVAAAAIVAMIWAVLPWRNPVLYATVEAADEPLYRISDGKTEPVRSGERIGANEIISSKDRGGVLALSDGSHVELRSQSQLSVEPTNDGARIRLDKGGVIVNAARHTTGHLYVKTKDLTVSVTGTVFLVKSEGAGSRVAVIEGEVHVQQDSTTQKLRPGEQVATNPLMESHPVREEIGWSRESEALVALLQQSAPGPAAPRPLEFAAAVVKPESTADEVRSTAVYCRGVDGVVAPFRQNGPPDIPLGRCVGRHVNLISLIAIAYDLKITNPGLAVVGGPDWVRDAWSSGYQIEAIAEDPSQVTKEQLREMLRTLAAERFKIRVSRETRSVDGLVLTVSRGVPKLQETSGEEGLTRKSKPSDGKIEWSITGRASMKTFADSMSFASAPFKRFVDKTGLAGIYDINLFYVVPLPAPPETGQRGGGGAETGAAALSAIQTALQEQLGLRLESAKVPEEFIVIEHAEKPAEN